jgi:hypothetical protein
MRRIRDVEGTSFDSGRVRGLEEIRKGGIPRRDE